MRSSLLTIAVGFLVVRSCFSQALELDGVFSVRTPLDLSLIVGQSRGDSPAGVRRRSIHTKANAVMIGVGYAITSAHCIQKADMTLTSLHVGKRRAQVLLVDDKLAVLAISDRVEARPAGARMDWDWASPAVGERLSHVYFDHASRKVIARPVTWTGLSAVSEGFKVGMSGSGLYSDAGKLVGVAEWTTGYAEDSLAIASLIEHTEAMGFEWSYPEGSLVADAR